jgi:hypothetical protein
MEDVVLAKVQMNVKVPEVIRDQVRRYAKAYGLSLNATVTLVLAQHLSMAGFPALPALPAVAPKEIDAAGPADVVAR